MNYNTQASIQHENHTMPLKCTNLIFFRQSQKNFETTNRVIVVSVVF